jgi:hypothetical protein
MEFIIYFHPIFFQPQYFQAKFTYANGRVSIVREKAGYFQPVGDATARVFLPT